jgi:hypothetical protein
MADKRPVTGMKKNKIRKDKGSDSRSVSPKANDDQTSAGSADGRDFGGMNMENFKKNLGCGG